MCYTNISVKAAQDNQCYTQGYALIIISTKQSKYGVGLLNVNMNIVYSILSVLYSSEKIFVIVMC